MLSSAAFAFSFLLLLVAWIAAVHQARAGQPVSGSVLFLAGLAPPLLVTLVMLAAGTRFGDLRVALEGLRFRLEAAGAGGVRVGGSPKLDHLVVHDLPPGFLTFRPTNEGLAVEITPGTPATSDDAQPAFAAVRVGDQHPFHNAVPLAGGAQVSVGHGALIAFDPKVPGFAGYPEIPSRSFTLLDYRIPVRIGRELTAEAAIHPLRYYAAASAKELLSAVSEPLGSFICRDGGLLRRDLFLVLTDPEIQVRRPRLPPAGFQPRVTTIPEGGSVHLALFRLDYHDPRVQEAARPSRAQERRSFTARYEKGLLEIVFDTPDFIRLERDGLDKLREQAETNKLPFLLTLAGEGFDTGTSKGQMLLRFASLGAPLGPELFSRIEPPQSGSDLRVTTHTGIRLFQLGDAFQVGEDGAVLLRVSRLDLPWGMLLLVWMTSAAALIASVGQRDRALDFLLLSGVEILLALRLLIAYQGSYLDPAAARATWESLGAFVAVPFILQAALALYERRGRLAPLLGHGLIATTALAAILYRARVEPKGWLALLLPLAAPLLLGRVLLPLLDRFPWNGTAALGGKRPWLRLVAIAVLLIIVRLVTLGALGWKERMVLGPLGVMAVSLYYIPWALLVFALLWGLRERRWAFAALWVLMGVLYVGIPALVHDWGTAFIFSLPALLLFALPSLEKPWRPRTLPLVLPLALMVAFHAVLPLFPALGLSHRLPGTWEASDVLRARTDPKAAEDLLAQKTQISRNSLRLWNLMAPAELRAVGTTEAESQIVVMENLRDYAAQGLLGAGYLGVPLSPPLATTQLDDNLSALHLLGTFGGLGSLLLLLLLAGWAVAPFFLATGGTAGMGSGIAPRTAFGLMLLWTLFAAGLYMLSANVELVVFTGKNIYFLAAASLSDAAEGTLLVTLALWAFRGPAATGGV
jgi:hypothetical protein